MIARHYRELECWQLSNELKKRIFAFLATAPAKHDFDFCRQIRGSARGATRTIAEGFGRFRPADFSRYLDYAHGSLMETQNHIDDALDSGYINQSTHKELFALANRAIGATSGLQRYLKTCHPEPLCQLPFTFSTCSITRRRLPPRIFSTSASA